MRSFLLALLAGAATVSAAGTQCAQIEINELVSGTTCGCSKSITACLGRNVDLESLEEIQQCFVGGGCSETEAMEQAVLFAQDCHTETRAADREELRKRQNNKLTTGKTTATEAKTTTSAEATTTADTTSASAAASSTTAAPSTTSTDSTTADSTTSMTSTTATSASATGQDSCYVTSTKATSACSIHAGTTVTCIPTVTAITSCAPGLLCFSPTAGANSCMKREDNLTTSGLIVTIVFAGGIGLAFLSWAIFCLRSRQRNKRQEQLHRMMERSGKGPDVESISPFAARPSTRANKAMRSDASLPLITPGGTRSDQQSYRQEGYFEQHGPEGNPPPPVPKLHPGLNALGQDSRI